MQAVCQLDDEDADVLAHGNEHLADGLRLLVRKVLHLDLRDLRDAFDQLGNGRAELFGKLLRRRVRVFHRVVQKRSAQRLHVHLQVREDDGDFDRVRDERFAAFAALALMRGRREVERFLQQHLVVMLKVRARQALKLAEARLGRDVAPCIIAVVLRLGREAHGLRVRASQLLLVRAFGARRLERFAEHLIGSRAHVGSHDAVVLVRRVEGVGHLTTVFMRCRRTSFVLLRSGDSLDVFLAERFVHCLLAHERSPSPCAGRIGRHKRACSVSQGTFNAQSRNALNISRSSRPSRYRTLSVNSTFEAALSKRTLRVGTPPTVTVRVSTNPSSRKTAIPQAAEAAGSSGCAGCWLAA